MDILYGIPIISITQVLILCKYIACLRRIRAINVCSQHIVLHERKQDRQSIIVNAFNCDRLQKLRTLVGHFFLLMP